MIFPKDKVPSLCGYCLRGGKGFYITINEKIYASCSYNHLEKIRERVAKKEDIKNTITPNPASVDKVLSEFKPIYLEYAKKNNSYIFHEWDSLDKKMFFQRFIALYLGLEDKLAREGMDKW